mgnify:CR=1 FL=1
MTYSYYSRFCESCKIPAKSVSLCETCPLRSAVICEVDEQDAAPPGREEDGRRIGLSNVTYLTDISYEVRAYDGGSLIESRPVGFPKRKKGGGMRGKITKFTRAARKRMMKKLATFRREELAKALFITLTYPAEYPDGKRAKRDLDRFLKRLWRKYPSAAWIWREELQKRGAPHFHLLVLGVDFIPHGWIAYVWWDVCGRISIEHLKAGTEVRRVKSYKHCFYYVTKYLAKEDMEVEAELGRRWGYGGCWRSFVGALRVFKLVRFEIANLARLLDGIYRAQLKAKGRRLIRRRKFIACSAFWLSDVSPVLEKFDGIIRP